MLDRHAVRNGSRNLNDFEDGGNTRNSRECSEETSVVFTCRPKLRYFFHYTVSSLCYQLLKFVCVNRAAEILFETQVCGPVSNFRYEMVYMVTRTSYRKSKKWLTVNIVGFINDRCRQANVLEKTHPHVKWRVRYCKFLKISQ
jgi:hypothetical protein